jgi:hypothetical protein
MLVFRQISVVGLVLLMVAASADAYLYDANDFASQVISYVPGTGITCTQDGEYYNDPSAALGGPTTMTAFEVGGWPDGNEPVNPLFPAWLPDEVVTVGNGGSIILKFNHPVRNDQNNPYGIDLIIYGNCMFAGSNPWTPGSDANSVTIVDWPYPEPGIVSVSEDEVFGPNMHWHTFSGPSAPHADSFAPTAAFRWDSANHRWDVNLPLDPTRPIDPALTPGDLAGLTVAQGIDRYNGSAGGAGFDIGALGLDRIWFVKIEDDPCAVRPSEVDSIADVSACGDYKHPFPVGDLNNDCRVNSKDFAILGENWLGVGTDLTPIANNWLKCSWECK